MSKRASGHDPRCGSWGYPENPPAGPQVKCLLINNHDEDHDFGEDKNAMKYRIRTNVEPRLTGKGHYEYEIQVTVNYPNGAPYWKDFSKRTVKRYEDIDGAVQAALVDAKAEVDR